MNIYVSKSGCDIRGDGTIEHPIASIHKAKHIVREILKTGYHEAIIVKIGVGKYFIDRPVIFTEEDSGSTTNPVIYRAEKKSPTDIVEISGASTLTITKWEEYEPNPVIKMVQLERNLKIDMLYVNGKCQVMARYPSFVEGAIPLGSAATEEDIKERVKKYSKVDGGYIRALHNCKWGGNSYMIRGKDDQSPIGLKLQWVGDNNRGSLYHPEAIVIENIFEELNTPGEWYYDNESGLLYYYPEVHMDINQSIFEVSVTSELIKFTGNGKEQAVKNIVFDGFDFTATKRTMFTVDEEGKNYVPLLRGDWCVVRAGAIYLENAENITIRNSNFHNIGGNGVFISGYNKGHVIDNNEFINIGSSCIQVVGLPTAVYEPSFWDHEHYRDRQDFVVHKTRVDFPENIGPKTDDYATDITVSQNHMYNIGIFEKQSSGVNLSMCRRVKILHNTIHKSARSCININDGTFGGHEIAYNDIFDSQRETEDHGPFNSWGRDRFWSVPNYNAMGLHGDVARQYAFLDVIDSIAIHDNRFHHSPEACHTWGIDLDDGSSNYHIFNNLCLGLGIKLREGFDRSVYNNIIIDGDIHIHCTYKKAWDSIHSNIICSQKPICLAGQGENEEERLHEGNYKVDKNWYFYFDDEIKLPYFWEGCGYDVNSIVNEDPGFKSPQANDYTVTNLALADRICFHHFPMDDFGKLNSKYQSPTYITERDSSDSSDALCEEGWKGAIITNINHSIMSSTASNGLKGVYFKNVPVYSAAYKLGFRTNDVLKQVNDKKMENKSALILYFDEYMGNDELTYTIHRLGRLQQVCGKVHS